MHPFKYQRPADIASATTLAASHTGAQFIAGGTSQVDLMKEGVQRPALLLDVSRLPLNEIHTTPSGGFRIGANVTNTELATNPKIAKIYTAISEAIFAGASQQIRNMASVAGNLLQRTRCPYLRDPAQACNKRAPGMGCAAINGFNRMHAIFGQSDEGGASAHSCIATHASDMAVAFAAHEAIVVVQNARGQKRFAFDELHRLPGTTPAIDTNLGPDDLITEIELPAFNGTSHYLKVRDRASYAYALVSCAVAVQMDGERIGSARIALGGVAHKPWRAFTAETMLISQIPSVKLFAAAASQALDGARTYEMNRYKPVLGRAIVERALLEATGLRPMQGPAGTALASSVGGLAGITPDSGEVISC